MKKIITITLLLFAGLTFGGELQKGLGNILVPKKKLNLPYKHYVTIQKSNGQILAFPLKSKSIDLNKLSKDKLYLLEFSPSTEELTIGEKKQKFTIVNLIKAKELSTKDLGTKEELSDLQKNAPKPLPGKSHLRINDTLTNTVIITAGAILLGSIIAN